MCGKELRIYIPQTTIAGITEGLNMLRKDLQSDTDVKLKLNKDLPGKPNPHSFYQHTNLVKSN